MKNKPVAPNTVLPKGAKLITPTQQEIGNYTSLTFDAKITLLGVTWFRVKDGLSGRNDREDWIADLPEVGPCVSDYCYREPRWGVHQYESFEEATTEHLKRALSYAEEKKNKTLDLVGRLDAAIKRLKDALPA